MAIIGYGRVSSTGQSLDVQAEQLRAAGCKKIFEEKVSGTSQKGRAQLAIALDYVREGDVFVVTRLDRLARSMSDLRDIIDRLMAKGVEFRAIQQGAIDTSTSGGRLMLNMLAAVAELKLICAESVSAKASTRRRLLACIAADQKPSPSMRSLASSRPASAQPKRPVA